MIYRIRVMKPAQLDIREIYSHIAHVIANPSAAKERVSLINEAIQSLKENPARFPFVRDGYLASKGYRFIVVKSHLVFFIIQEKTRTVSIRRILYSRRDWLSILRT